MGTQPYGKDTEVGRLEDEEGAARARYAGVIAQLQADHPDAQRARRELGDIQARLQQAKARAAANTLEQKRMEAAIDRGHKNLDKLQSRMVAVDARVGEVPQNGARIGELSQGVEVLKVKVTQLISKKAEAELAADLEHRQAASEYRVLESAAMPTLPASPNRMMALLIALLGALFIGGAAGVMSEMSDHTLRSESEAGSAVALPVLAQVPRIHETRASAAVLALPPVH
jgi:uncharacterized protein involved in exopolysaccharide biosynthesis